MWLEGDDPISDAFSDNSRLFNNLLGIYNLSEEYINGKKYH